jgi:phospholipid/cholesterol/gamma-HCH transport system substrate-binding protein
MEKMLAAQQQALGTVLEQTAAVARNLNAATDPTQVSSLRAELSGAAGGLAQLTARLDSTAAAATAVLGSLRERQGSVGMLLNDPQLYQRTTELLASADALVKDFKANPKKYINVSVF